MDSTSPERAPRAQPSPFVLSADAPWTDPAPGIRRQVLGTTGDLMLVRVDFVGGAVGSMHHHEHRQVTWVATGRFRATVGGETCDLGPGDSFLAERDVPHGVLALEAGTLIDVFTPMRTDFLAPGESR